MDWKEQIKTYNDEFPIRSREDKILQTIQKSQETFYYKEQEKLLSYREFLWIQFRLIRKKWWLLQLLLLLGTGMLLPLLQEEFFIQRGLSVAGVLFIILIIPELWKNKTNQCLEIEGTSYYSLRQIYSCRIFLFGIVDIALLTTFSLLLCKTLHLTLVALLSQFLFPATVTACICFGLLCSKHAVNETISMIFCILWSAVWWFLTANEKFYALLKLPVWIVLLGIAIFFLGGMIHKTLRDCTNDWEDILNETEYNESNKKIS